MKVKKFLYFSPEIRAFFESVEKVTKCPVSRQELINVNDLRFLSYASKICPITYEDLKEDDSEIIIYDESDPVSEILHEIGHVYWNTKVNQNETDLFKQLQKHIKKDQKRNFGVAQKRQRITG